MKRYYIMQKSVEPMLSDIPTYTPMTNHKTDVHTVELVMASDYDQLKAEKEQAAILAETFRTAWCVLNTEREQLKAENERLSKITCVTMGVGNGSGSLFVHGDYESIKAAQAAVIERDTLRKQLDDARELLRIAASGAICNSVHHDKKDQHAYDEQCPVLHRIYAWLEANKP